MKVALAVQNDAVCPRLDCAQRLIVLRVRGSVEQSRLNKARWKIARQSHSRYLGLSAMLNNMVGVTRLGYPLTAMTDYPQHLAGVTIDSMAGQLATCAGHEVIGIAGPAEALKEPLSELGYPLHEVEVERQPTE